jgi:hypothetical protein
MLAEETPHLTEPPSRPGSLKSPPRRDTVEDYLEAGRDAYDNAQRLEREAGELTPGVIAEYRRASTNLISVTAAETTSFTGKPKPSDPIRLLKIADSLAKQAEATDINPYSGPDYQSGGRFERIRTVLPDGTVEQFTPHEYMHRLSRMYVLKASDIFLGGDGSNAHGSIGEPMPGIIADAAVEAAQETEQVTQEYRPPFAKAGSDDGKAIDVNQLMSFIGENAKRPDTGAEFIAKMSELVVEKTAELPELAYAA